MRDLMVRLFELHRSVKERNSRNRIILTAAICNRSH